MRSRDGDKRPCQWCKAPTVFEVEVFGPRGGSRGWKTICRECGEQPARRARYEKAAA